MIVLDLLPLLHAHEPNHVCMIVLDLLPLLVGHVAQTHVTRTTAIATIRGYSLIFPQIVQPGTRGYLVHNWLWLHGRSSGIRLARSISLGHPRPKGERVAVEQSGNDEQANFRHDRRPTAKQMERS